MDPLSTRTSARATAWLNWPQIHSGGQSIGLARTIRGRRPTVPGIDELVQYVRCPAGVLLEDADADPRRRHRRTSRRAATDRERPHPPTWQWSRRRPRTRGSRRPSASPASAARATRRRLGRSQERRPRDPRRRSSPVPTRSSASAGSRSPASNARTRDARRRLGRGKPGRLEDAVARLDLEAHALVQPPAVCRRPSTSVRQPASWRRSMIACVIARPRPRPRHAGARKIVPSQPTGPFASRPRCPTISPPRRPPPSAGPSGGSPRAAATRAGRPSRATGSCPSPDRRRRRSIGRISGMTIPFSIIRRWPDSPAPMSSTSPSSRACA